MHKYNRIIAIGLPILPKFVQNWIETHWDCFEGFATIDIFNELSCDDVETARTLSWIGESPRHEHMFVLAIALGRSETEDLESGIEWAEPIRIDESVYAICKGMRD